MRVDMLRFHMISSVAICVSHCSHLCLTTSARNDPTIPLYFFAHIFSVNVTPTSRGISVVRTHAMRYKGQ